MKGDRCYIINDTFGSIGSGRLESVKTVIGSPSSKFAIVLVYNERESFNSINREFLGRRGCM